MRRQTAEALVFTSSAAVLVIEIAAVRLMAPYVGQTLQTFTAIISTVLAGIAAGTFLGGRLADQEDPARLVRIEVFLGGLLTIVLVPLVRVLGPPLAEAGLGGLIALTAFSVLLPAAVLSAVAPAVVKIQLSTLTETGATVGRYSAFGTAGAIAGSVTTGFVLLARFTTTSILIGLGLALCVTAVALWITSDAKSATGGLAVAALLAALAGLTPGPCDTETRYYCVRILPAAGGDGSYLVLDDLYHSYVNPLDPTDLDFSYIRTFATVIDATSSGPVSTVHIGGGGFTMPRWLDATRPGSTSRVLELDEGVVEVSQDRLGLTIGSGIEVSTGDARLSIRPLSDGSADLVIGDAFGGRAVPWHLTTVEFHREIDRVLHEDGHYVLNVIDGPTMRFVGSMVATLGEVFPHVSIVGDGSRLERGGNVVLVAGESPLPVEAVLADAPDRGLDLTVLSGAEAARFAEGVILTDDYAPVDQLLTR